ncbi:hypothetical protein C2845_PM07G36270 [Panicum miliaceum]|uniref:Uncharacterized protein n=1 Tax=Panicum miliaceum TaxID=4540 RepID=A0A3L6SHN7_PANMI|nr:hypothetical protein C2845_PM07G36270 [Panicum miliaceum]
MGRRRSGRRRAAAVEAGGSGTPDDSPQKKSSSSSGHQAATSLSQQTVEEETPSPPPQDTRALRRRLLAQIRRFYLDAISRLPTADLRATLARGLLVGGYCFGPLHPVHNIIANSVWYADAFPLRPADRIDLDVVSSQATDRAARRSFDGLVACLLRICPFLSPADALWRLNRSRADLRVAVASVQCAKPSLLRAADQEIVKSAFQEAAEAARHPTPAAFALFASSLLPGVERDVSRLLVSRGGGLSSLDIRRLSSVLLPYPVPNEPCRSVPDPSPEASKVISGKKRNVPKWYKCLLGIADAALASSTAKLGYTMSFIPYMPKEDHSSSSGVGLGCRLFFFAEAPRPPHKDFREEDISICCPVEPSPGDIDNCHACLMDKEKINHPAVEPVYHTHVLRFGEQCFEIGAVDHDWDFRPALGVDFLCFDSDRDYGLLEYLHNLFARIHAYLNHDEK